jgi:hypothetical protein
VTYTSTIMSSLHTSQPACSDHSEFSSNLENHVQGETASCHQHKKAFVLKDLSDFIYKLGGAKLPQMTVSRNTQSNQNLSRNTVSHFFMRWIQPEKQERNHWHWTMTQSYRMLLKNPCRLNPPGSHPQLISKRKKNIRADKRQSTYH